MYQYLVTLVKDDCNINYRSNETDTKKYVFLNPVILLVEAFNAQEAEAEACDILYSRVKYIPTILESKQLKELKLIASRPYYVKGVLKLD